VRRDVIAYVLASLDLTALVVWVVWSVLASPGQTVFLYGTASYYVLGVVFLMLACMGFGVLARFGGKQWRGASEITLWVSSALVLMPLGLYVLLELSVLSS